MPPIKLFLIRHSKSCANHVRHLAGTEDRNHPLVMASQEIRDPALSAVGTRMATAYGPAIQARLAAAGFDLETAVIGSSHLHRAKQTAAALFPFAERRLVTLPHFTEHGALPENTPAGMEYRAPNWDALIRHLNRKYAHAREFVIVGHGSYLRTQVWPAVTGRTAAEVRNLDGLLVTGDLKNGRLRVTGYTEVPYTGAIDPHAGEDQCALPRKIASLTRRMRGQRGGGVNMPLAYFQNGAQMKGTYADETGVGMAETSSGWVRAPLAQTGGRRRTQRQRGGFSCQNSSSSRTDGVYHRGGFSPAVMGQFATNGLRLIPIASYMGYRMVTKKKRRVTKKRNNRRSHKK